MGTLEEICTAKGWILDLDLTEAASGLATPVGRVIADGDRGLLRLSPTADAVDAYQAFSDSGITPRVYGSGESLGTEWLLVEWIEGETAMEHALRNPTTALRSLADASHRVVQATLALPRQPAPPSEAPVFDMDVRALEAHIVVDGALAKSAPMLHKLSSDWTDAIRLHGDATPSNVIFGPSGETRLVDVRGDWGPLERSVAQWSAALVFTAQTSAEPTTFEDYAAKAIRLTDGVAELAPDLDRSKIRRWTAEQLCRAAWELKEAGVAFHEWRALAAVAGHLWVDPELPANAERVGRNDRCPCGSGKKFKICCGL